MRYRYLLFDELYCVCVRVRDCVLVFVFYFTRIPVNTTCGVYTSSQSSPYWTEGVLISCIYKGSPCVDQVQVGVVKQGTKSSK